MNAGLIYAELNKEITYKEHFSSQLLRNLLIRASAARFGDR